MKYNRMIITPGRQYCQKSSKRVWKVDIYYDQEDRVKGPCIPSAMGFLHYWSSMSNERAFEILKKKMIAAHEEAVANLQKSLHDLQKLQLPDKLKSRPKKAKS